MLRVTSRKHVIFTDSVLMSRCQDVFRAIIKQFVERFEVELSSVEYVSEES